MSRKLLKGMIGVAALAMSATTGTAATLDDVKAKGFVQCGVSEGLPGFSNPVSSGTWCGVEGDHC